MKKYALLKIISINTVIIWGFLQPAVFDRFLSETDFAFLTIFYGYGLFLDFFDFGVNKPIYVRLRKQYIAKEAVKTTLLKVLQIYILILGFMSLVFAGFMLFNSYRFENQLFKITIFLLVINICFTTFFSYCRHLLFAIDEFIFFENLDITRKTLNIITIFFLVFDPSYLLTVISNLLGFTFIFWLIIKRLNQHFDIKIKEIRQNFNFQSIKESFLEYAYDSKYSFLFTLNLNLTMNIGFILFPLFLSSFEVIQFGLWYKIAYGAAMFIVAFSDFTLHHITRFFLNNEIAKAFRYFLFTILATVVSVSLLFLVFYIFKSWVFQLWVDTRYEFDFLITISLLAFFIGRSLEYISATILLSLGNFFKKAAILSLLVLILGFSVLLSLLFFNKILPLTLFAFSLIVLLNGLIYFSILTQKFLRKG